MTPPKKRRCVFCDRKAVAGWVDWEGRLTVVCRGHQRIADAACGSAQAEFVTLSDFPRNHQAPNAA